MSKKKEKITYIDDGRTIADMSGIQGGFSSRRRPSWQPALRFKDVWNTYWAVVKLMLRPMLVVVIGLIVIYAVLLILFSAM